VELNRSKTILAVPAILLMLGLAISLAIGVPVAQAQGPVITSVSPEDGSPGQTLPFTISGSGFTGVTSVNFGSDITVTGYQAIDPSQIVGNITINSSAACGLRDVTVSAGGYSFTSVKAFTVLRPPVVNSIWPTSADQGTTSSTLTIQGACFLGNTDLGEVQVAFLLDGTPDPEIFVSFSVNSTKDKITASISIMGDAALGSRDVRVTAQGGLGILYGGFTVKRPAPNVISVSPNTVYQGQSQYVEIVGSYLTGATSVSFGSGVTVVGFAVVSDTRIVTKVSVASSTTAGLRDVSVTTPGGVGTLTGGLYITAFSDVPIITPEEPGTPTGGSNIPQEEPMIKILSPNTGTEKWEMGSLQTITWTASPSLLDNPVKIEYSLNGGSTWRTAVSRTANDGIEPWKVTEGPTNRALIRIRTLLYPEVYDVSDMMFTISLPTITVLTPNGPFGEGASFQEGEKWELGTPQTITWKSSAGLSGDSKVQIQISYDGGKRWQTIKSSTPNSGVYTWKEVKGNPSTQAMIKITSRSNKDIWDTNDAFFRVILPTIEVSSPNAMEKWELGTAQIINWTSSPGVTNKVKIHISYDGGKRWKTITNSTPNDGTYAWKKVKGTLTNHAMVRVISRSDKRVWDTSDAFFSITLPTIRVLSPNGGENWTIGSYQTITWTSSPGLTGKVRIQLSRDGGRTWKKIKSSTPNDGIETWKVTGEPTDRAFIVVLSRSNRAIFDSSDAAFLIR